MSGQQEQIFQSLPIPEYKTGWIIGKRGSYIKQLEKKAGATITISDVTSKEFGTVWKYVQITGNGRAVDRVKKLLHIRLERFEPGAVLSKQEGELGAEFGGSVSVGGVGTDEYYDDLGDSYFQAYKPPSSSGPAPGGGVLNLDGAFSSTSSIYSTSGGHSVRSNSFAGTSISSPYDEASITHPSILGGPSGSMVGGGGGGNSADNIYGGPSAGKIFSPGQGVPYPRPMPPQRFTTMPPAKSDAGLNIPNVFASTTSEFFNDGHLHGQE